MIKINQKSLPVVSLYIFKIFYFIISLAVVTFPIVICYAPGIIKLLVNLFICRGVEPYLVNATGDYCQGITVKGESPGSKIFWCSWDMYHSYVDVIIDIKKMNIAKREL